MTRWAPRQPAWNVRAEAMLLEAVLRRYQAQGIRYLKISELIDPDRHHYDGAGRS